MEKMKLKNSCEMRYSGLITILKQIWLNQILLTKINYTMLIWVILRI